MLIKDAVLTRDVETFGKMDPYVTWQYAGKEWKTTVKSNAGKTPNWNEAFRLPIVDQNDTTHIKFVCWDKETLGKDREIGEGELMVSDLMDNTPINLFYKNTPVGVINLSSEWKDEDKHVIL